MFDTIYSFATAIKAAESSLKKLDSGNVSCIDSIHLEHGAQLSTFVEKA
jgi:hypothetical protein